MPDGDVGQKVIGNFMVNYSGLSIDTVRTALFFLDYDDTEIWLMAGMAIRHEFGEEGFDLWNSWSSFGSSYNAKNAKARWKSFRSGKGVTIGSLIYHAIKSGFKFDGKVQRVSPHVIAQREERKKQLEIEAKQEEQRTAQQQAKSANKAQWIWNNAKEVDNHKYLAKKDVMPHGLRVREWTYKDEDAELKTETNCLIVPLFFESEIVSLQGIFPDGTKKLLYGAKKQGVHFIFGEYTHTILICEGWATGATLYEATQLMTFVSIDAGNLEHVARYVRKKYPLSRIVICADNDQYNKSNTGIKSAIKSACAVDADIAYPIFKSIENQPTDFNDLYHESGYNAVYERVVTPTMYYAKENDAEYFNAFDLPYIEDAERVLEESQFPLEVARAAKVVAMRMAEKIPSAMTLEQIRKFIAHPLLSPSTHTSIMKSVQWSVFNRKRLAMTALKAQSWGKHNRVVVANLEDYKPITPVSLVFAPMGSGKTRNIITPFSKIESKTFCAVAHRRSLIADLSEKLHVPSYENATKEKTEVQEKMAVCLPSIVHPVIEPFIDRVQHVAVDEISQNIRFTSSRECKAAGKDQEDIFFKLRTLVNQSECVIAADASIDQTTLDFFQEARPDEIFTIVEKIPTNERERKCFLYADRADLLTKIELELMNGGNVWLAVESAEKAEVIHQIFNDKFKCLLITSKNSKSKEIKRFLDNIEKSSRDYQLIIASPAISSGVSVEHHDSKHFTMIAGIASGNSICFSDFAQMLGRVRYVDHYHVYLQPNNKRFEHVNAASILTGLRQAAMLEGNSLKENEFSKFKAHIEATEEMYRADFANGFCWFLEYYCFEILSGRVSEVNYDLSVKMKELSSEAKKKYVNSIREAEKISSDKAAFIDAKLEQTEDEYFELIAYKIRHSLGFPLDHDLEEQDITMFENMPKLDRFARYLGLTFEHDDSEKNISLRRFQNAQIHATEIIFDNLDLSSAFFEKSLCDEIMRRVASNNNRFLLSSLKMIPSKYGQWKESKRGELLEMKLPENNSKAVAQILDKFGLSWRRTQRGHANNCYKVTDDSFNLMKEYALRRYQKTSAI